MAGPKDEAASDSVLENRVTYYRKFGAKLRGASAGEPINTGKGVEHFLARARAFASSGRVLNIVTLGKREVR